MESRARGIESDVQALGFAVTCRHGKTQIQTTSPALEQSWMQALLIRRLLRRTTHQSDRCFWRLYRARSLSRHNDVVAVRGHRTNYRLATQRYIQVARRGYALDRVKLYGYVTSSIGLNHQYFPIGLRDRASQPVAVL